MRTGAGRALRAVVAASLIATGLVAAASSASAPAGAAPPPVGHVWTIVLENKTWEAVNGATGRAQMPFLTALGYYGVQLNQMYGVDHVSLGNYIALTSGKETNAKTRADCLFYDCVYPDGDDENIADQIEAAPGGLTWKAYMESMPAPCTHGTPGELDPYLVTDYVTRHNPFMYYDGIVSDTARCEAHDVPLADLETDLTTGTAPNYSFISPGLCNDAHTETAPCGLPAADNWLRTWIPKIIASSEYQDDGMILITFDESNASDRRSCCGGAATGGREHTLVLSGAIQAAGRDSGVGYNHYSLLRTVQDALGLPCLNHSCDANNPPLGDDVFGPRPANDFAIAAPATPVYMSGGDTRAATLTSSVKTTSATPLTLSVSASNASITPSVSPTTITSGGSATVFAKSTASAVGETVLTVTATNGAGISHSVPLTVRVIGGPVNGSFEASSSIAPWTTAKANPAVVTTGGVVGPRAARTGATTPKKGLSKLAQTFTVPASATTLTVRSKLQCGGPDYAEGILRDNAAKVNVTVVPRACTNTGTWRTSTYNVSALRNKSVTLTLQSKDDGAGVATNALWDEIGVS